MKTFNVYLVRTVTYHSAVVAESPEQAAALARQADDWEYVGDEDQVTAKPEQEIPLNPVSGAWPHDDAVTIPADVQAALLNSVR